MSDDLPPTREDVYYYVEDDTGGLRYMTRTLQPHHCRAALLLYAKRTGANLPEDAE